MIQLNVNWLDKKVKQNKTKQNKTYDPVDVAVSACNKVKVKEDEKLGKYLDLADKLKNFRT